MTPDELCREPATELALRLRRREISAVELLRAHLDRIERLDGRINAVVTRTPDLALQRARAADDAITRGELLGVLHGLPTAHKDLVQTAGIRTTFGSPIYADHVPDTDDLLVQRVRDAGAVVLGKTNTPEWGAGSHTFNPVFGVTRNPWDLERSAGGSSGGAAAALAACLITIADGSDLGGSLRNPAAFCGVVGFRPTPGRVPSWPANHPSDSMSVDGPMGRTVGDVALLLSAIAGPDARIPISLPDAGSTFTPPLTPLPRPLRVAFAPLADGRIPFEAGVAEAVRATEPVLRSLGWDLEPAFPSLDGARDVFLMYRGASYARELGPLLPRERERIKATVLTDVDRGLALTADDLARAERAREAIRAEAATFFGSYDLLVLPTTQTMPFDVDLEYPTEIAGVAMETYLDWMESCWAITVTGCPAISIPVRSIGGLPVGMQLVAGPGRDLDLLRAAATVEAALTPVGFPPGS
jgi:amidase